MAVVTVPATTTTTTTTATTAAPAATTTAPVAVPTVGTGYSNPVLPAAAPVTTTAAPIPILTEANIQAMATGTAMPVSGTPQTLVGAVSNIAPDTPTRLPGEALGAGANNPNDQAGLDAGTFGKTPDGGMPRDTAEILASGLLTAEQVESAKLDNIYKLYDCPGCSEKEMLELGLYMQRYVLDGYIRGVDVPQMILNGNDEKIQFTLQDGWVSGIADTGGGPKVSLTGFMGTDDAWKFSLFYHEVSHNILDRGHNSNSQSIMYGPSGVGDLRSGSQIAANYDYMLGELFNPDNWGKVAPGGNAKLTVAPSGYQGSGEALPTPPAQAPVPKSNVPVGTVTSSSPTAPVYTTGSNPVSSPTPRGRSYPTPIPTMSIGPDGEINIPQQLGGSAGGGGSPSTQMPSPYSWSLNPQQNAAAASGGGSAAVSYGVASGAPNDFESELSQLLQQASPMLSSLGGTIARMSTKGSTSS